MTAPMDLVERRGIAQRLVRLMATLIYRDIDVVQAPGLDLRGPVLAVSNHFGGLSDGVLLVDSAPRMPRVVARDVIWRIPVAGRLATAVGMIPVHRAADGGRASNDEMFRTAYEALGADALVLIFPEGVTQDVPHMAAVRTGAARIALGARAWGVAGLRILPIGLHYEDKAGFRTRALVNLGEPIDLDSWAAAREGLTEGAEDQAAVRDLTELIDRQLRQVAPDFADWSTVRALHTAAQVVLDDVEPQPSTGTQYGDREIVAARMNRAAEPARSGLVAAARAYREELGRARTSDRRVAVAGSAQSRSLWWVIDLVMVLLLMPFALLGALTAAVPLLLVVGVSRLPVAAAVRATAVPAVALLTFLGEWLLVGWRSIAEHGWVAGALTVLLLPFYVGALFVVAERTQLLWRRWRSSRRPRGAQLERLRAQRAEVSDRGWVCL